MHPPAPLATPAAAIVDVLGASIDAVGHRNEIVAARGYVAASRAPATRRAYATDWRRFQHWCAARGANPLPGAPALVAVHLSALAASGLAPASVGRALAAIAHAHVGAGLVAPHRMAGGGVVVAAMAGIRRARPGPPARKLPADAEMVERLLAAIVGDGLGAMRDRALIAFGMALAARRSELVALDVADLAWEAAGVRVTIRRSKTDQEGAGAVVAVPDGMRLRPVRHLRAWLDAAGIVDGPVFRPLWKPRTPETQGKREPQGRVREQRLSDHAVARIVQARAAAAGLDPAGFGGHSLRAGFVTAAARAGADVWKIQQVSRHRSLQVLAGYVRDARLFDDHAGASFL